jgi:heptosyltransferase-2
MQEEARLAATRTRLGQRFAFGSDHDGPRVVAASRHEEPPLPDASAAPSSQTEANHAPAGSDSLLIRYHSLGDVILTTGLIRALDQIAPGSITVATEERFFPVFEGNPHVARLWGRTELETLAHDPSRPRFGHVLDLQGTAGTRALSPRFGPSRTIRSRSLARRWVVLWGDRPPRPNIPHAVERYAETAWLDGVVDAVNGAPEAFVTDVDREELAREAPEWQSRASGPRVALLTGASRRSKAYPLDQFRDLGERLAAQGAEILWVEDPARSPAESVGTRLRVGLRALKAALAQVDLAISGDSGPMHLASALGTPTLALFGSSVRAFGFTPLGRTRVLEVSGLSCRPCGVHGRDRCWRGHWRCVRDLTPELVTMEAIRMLREAEAG